MVNTDYQYFNKNHFRIIGNIQMTICNFINKKRNDLTASQFKEIITYEGLLLTREDGFADNNAEQYTLLKQKVLTALFHKRVEELNKKQ
jgi:hypothetical protein